MGEKPRRLRRRLLLATFATIAAAVLTAGVYWPRRKVVATPRDRPMGWRPVLSRSGRGTAQTESFQIDTGQFRIKWAISPGTDETAVPGEFRVGVHSAVSGRLMHVAIDYRGAGEGIAYVAEEPRPFFLSVESSGADWTLQVEEGSPGERMPR